MPSTFNKVDATSFFEKIIIKKTSEELENLEKGAKFLDHSFKKLIDAVEEIIDDNNDTKMSEISNKIKQSLETENNKDIKQFKTLNPQIDVDNLYYNLPILIQSGGNFAYHQTAESENKPLADDTIWLSICCEYAEVCAAAARTLKINPTPEEKEDYLLLRKVFASLFSSLKYGRKISECYNEIYSIFAKEKNEEWLTKHLGENFGYGIGFKYEEKSLEIIPTNDTVIDEDMVFFIRLYFKDLEYREKQGIGIVIGDTIVVTKNGNKNLTKHIRKNYEDISYVINEDDEEEEEEEEKNEEVHKGKNGKENKDKSILLDSRTRSLANNEKRPENIRKEHQDELLNIKLAELNERINNNEIVISSSKQNVKNMADIKSYKNSREIPTGIPAGKIYLDDKRDTILLPINKKVFIPIHLALVKNISFTGENETSYLRINLHTPGALNINQNMIFPNLNTPNSLFLRELSFRSSDMKSLGETHKNIKEHMKKMKQLEKEKDQNISLAKQEQLSINKGKRIVMEYMIIRPNITTRKTIGTLEAHSNGMRFTSQQNEKIDISYSNIKHCFFQP